MVLVDVPKGPKGSPAYQNQSQLKTLIRGMGVGCEDSPLAWGDAAMEGNGPDGILTIGVERKALHDMLNCIDDAHYAGKQRLGMKQMYNVSFLMIEGFWKPREDGVMMESRDGTTWWPCKPNGRMVMYSKLRRYIISLTHSGVIVNFTRTLWHTAYDICEIFHYHSKKWNDHTSLREIHKMAIPQLNGKPSLTRMWASCIDDIGVKKGEDAEALFRRPITLATADETQWLKIKGISPKMAQEVVRRIHGIR